MGNYTTTAILGVTLVGAILVACSGVGRENARSDEAALAVPADAEATDTGTADAGPGFPKDCDKLPPKGKPRRECIDYCKAALEKAKDYQCIMDLIASMNGSGTPTVEQMEKCGCTDNGIDNSTGVGPRHTYSCEGPPPFSVSPVPGKGIVGIIVDDPKNYPGCFFDIGGKPPTPVYDNTEGNYCLRCHKIDDPTSARRIALDVDDPTFNQ